MMIIKCDECGSEDVSKAGRHWRVASKNPKKRVKLQAYRCNVCGKLFVPKDSETE